MRHRYAFRSTEKVALQEIGPRFTLKLRSLKKGLPAVKNFGQQSKALEFDAGEDGEDEQDVEMDGKEIDPEVQDTTGPVVEPQARPKKVVPPSEDEYLWLWKVRLVHHPLVHGRELIALSDW